MATKIRTSGTGNHTVVYNRGDGNVTIGAVISCYCSWFLWWRRTCHHCRAAGCYCRRGWFGRRHVCHHCLGHVADPRVDDLQRQVNTLRRQMPGVQRQITVLHSLWARRPLVQPCTQPHINHYPTSIVDRRRTYNFGADIAWGLVLLVGVIVGLLTWLFHGQIESWWGIPNTLDWRVGLPFVAGCAAAALVALVSGVVSFIRNR